MKTAVEILTEARALGPWIVSRVATKNPEINGRALYLTGLGMWSLDQKHAREFAERDEAQKWARPDANVEAVTEATNANPLKAGKAGVE